MILRDRSSSQPVIVPVCASHQVNTHRKHTVCLQVWGDHSQPQIVQVEAFSPNSQAAAAKSATVHDPVRYNKAAEELQAVADCLKSVHRGVYYEINVKLKAELAAATPSFLADCEQGRLPETRTCPCVRNHYVSLPVHLVGMCTLSIVL